MPFGVLWPSPWTIPSTSCRFAMFRAGEDQSVGKSLAVPKDGQVALGRYQQVKEVVCVGLHLLIQTWRDLKANPSLKRRWRDGR
jgi:hypothetical protein